MRRKNMHYYGKKEQSLFGRHHGYLIHGVFLFSKGELKMAKLESEFQRRFMDELRYIFPGCIVFKTDASYIQGFPDLLMLYNNRWAAFECKRSSTATVRPNQKYYVDILDMMSFARFVYPENEEEVLNEVQQAFGVGRNSCSFRR